MQKEDLFRDIGRIVQVEYSGSRLIGYVSRLEANRIYLVDFDPKIEAQKSWCNKRGSRFLKLHLTDILNPEELSPPLLTPENLDSLKPGTPLTYRYDGSVGVGYVVGVTPKKIKIDSYDPTVEIKKSWWDRGGLSFNYKLSDLILPVSVPLSQTQNLR